MPPVDLRAALEGVGLTIEREGIWQRQHTKYVLRDCPFHPHKGKAKACAIAFADGRVRISCRSTKCKGKRWADLCAQFPDLATYGFSDHLNVAPLPTVVRMDQITTRSIEWLWDGRLARGKVHLFVGEPGAGKSKVACEVTAYLTTGRSLPFARGPISPINVLFCTAEDDLEDTVKPRLVQAGAELIRVHATADPFVLDVRGIQFLEDQITTHKADLVFIDPWSAYAGARTDVHRANHTRPIFAALAGVATRRNCAIVVVHHPNKSETQKAIFRVSGSVDIVGAARLSFLFGVAPGAPGTGVMIPLKSNISGGAASLGYHIDEASGQFTWTGLSNLTAEDVLSTHHADSVADAAAFIRNALAGGPRPSDDVKGEALASGISFPTYRRALKQLGVKAVAQRQKGKRGVQLWMLTLPPSP